MNTYRVLVEFDFTPEDWSGVRRVIVGDKLTAEDLSPERAAEMIALGVLEQTGGVDVSKAFVEAGT